VTRTLVVRESVTVSGPPSQHADTHERERAVCDEGGGLHQDLLLNPDLIQIKAAAQVTPAR